METERDCWCLLYRISLVSIVCLKSFTSEHSEISQLPLLPAVRCFSCAYAPRPDFQVETLGYLL